MSVYVDKSRNAFGRMIMCHMIADSLDELHVMSDRIGVARRWFQRESSFPHYDICLQMRRRAIDFGAIELGRRRFVAKLRELRG